MLFPWPLLLMSGCLALIFLALGTALGTAESRRWSLRDIFLLSVTMQGVLVWAVVEILSYFHAFRRDAVISSWILIMLALALVAALRVRFVGFNWRTVRGSQAFVKLRSLGTLDKVMLAGVGLQVLCLTLVAASFPPSNVDSLQYHMVRVVNWIQAGTVAHYATGDVRQLASPPFAEYQIANLQVMQVTDAYANFVQLFAFIVGLVSITCIVKKLGGNATLQLAAAAIGASLPMAILQATSTQNDLVAAEWVVCFICLGLSIGHRDEDRFTIMGVGFALGLAGLTKPTALIVAAPFCVWFGLRLLADGRKGFMRGTLLAALALAVMCAPFIRNWMTFADPLGGSAMRGTLNGDWTPSAVASNLIRDVALNFTGPGGRLVSVPLSVLERLHALTGANTTDPRTTLDSPNVFSDIRRSLYFHEDAAGNPIHLLLGLLAVIWICLRRPRDASWGQLVTYSIALVTGFLLFAVLLKYQQWGNRLLLPVFICSAPLIAVGLVPRLKWAGSPIVLAVLAVSFIWTFQNASRPAIELALPIKRDRAIFVNQPELYWRYRSATRDIAASGCQRVGLNLSNDSWEYPLWVLLADRGWTGQIRHLEVHNASATLADPKFVPCAIVASGSDAIDTTRQKYLAYHEAIYKSLYVFLQK